MKVFALSFLAGTNVSFLAASLSSGDWTLFGICFGYSILAVLTMVA